MEKPMKLAPRPCSAPHSAPVSWLRYDPAIDPPRHEADGSEASSDEPRPLTPEQQHRQDIDRFLTAYEGVAPERERRDGWTPFLRKLFLQVIAEGGGISTACAYTHMSRSAAYALEARDRVFAAGLAAAAHFARGPMADDFYEKGRHGITETITRSDGATVTRHRFDSRLSIAVLNRLDRRCDRAEERGSIHLAAVRNWDEYLRLVGDGEDAAAEALLDRPVPSGVEAAQHCPTCTLPERANPISRPDPTGCDPSENCWKAGSADDLHPDRAGDVAVGTWITTFPPPAGFEGYQNVEWDGDRWYERACTVDEAALLDAHQAAEEASWRAERTADAEAERDNFFAGLRTAIAELDPAQGSGAGKTR